MLAAAAVAAVGRAALWRRLLSTGGTVLIGIVAVLSTRSDLRGDPFDQQFDRAGTGRHDGLLRAGRCGRSLASPAGRRKSILPSPSIWRESLRSRPISFTRAPAHGTTTPSRECSSPRSSPRGPLATGRRWRRLLPCAAQSLAIALAVLAVPAFRAHRRERDPRTPAGGKRLDPQIVRASAMQTATPSSSPTGRVSIGCTAGPTWSMIPGSIPCSSRRGSPSRDRSGSPARSRPARCG